MQRPVTLRSRSNLAHNLEIWVNETRNFKTRVRIASVTRASHIQTEIHLILRWTRSDTMYYILLKSEAYYY